MVLTSAFLFWGTSLFFYQAPRSFLPLFVPFLIILYRKEIQDKKYVILLVLATIILPVFLILRSSTLSLRLSSVSIVATPESELALTERILLGIAQLPRLNKRVLAVFCGWITLVPVGSTLAFDDIPNLQRTLAMVPAITTIASVGFFALWRTKTIIRATLLFWLLACLVSYLHGYYVHQLYHRPWYRHEGYEELTKKLTSLSPSYQRIIVTNHESAPSLFVAYFSNLDPAIYQNTYLTRRVHINRVPFGNFEFPEVDCPTKEFTQSEPSKTLFVDAATCEKPLEAGFLLLEEIKRNDGTVVFRLYQAG